MPIADIQKLIPQGLRDLIDAGGEDVLDFMSSPNVDALGDAIEQSGRGQPPNPVGMGMVFGGAGLQKVPQLVKFLRKLKQTAQNPVIQELTTVAGRKMPKMSAVQQANRAYTGARRTSAASKTAGMHSAYPGKNPGNIAGLYSSPNTPAGKRGAIGVFEDVFSGRRLQEQQGSATHELLHSQDATRAGRKGQKWSDWYKREAQRIGTSGMDDLAQTHPAEMRAGRAAATGEQDIKKFIQTGNELRPKLPMAERQTFDDFAAIYNQSAREQKNRIAGRVDSAPYEEIESAWKRITGKAPKTAGATETGELTKVAGQAVKKFNFPKGAFVDIKGNVTELKGKQVHTDIINKLRRQKKEIRGFEVREGSVRLQALEDLKHKKGLEKAMEAAWGSSWTRTGTFSDVIVEVPGVGFARVPLDEREFFMLDPRKYIEEYEKAHKIIGGAPKFKRL